MGLEELNTMGADECRTLLRSCADVPRWADTLTLGRPYTDTSALLGAADATATTWTDAEVEAALADHPRIGDRHPGDGASAAHSAREQAGVDTSDAEVQHRLVDGNRAYEDRFGRVFLVRAAGRSSAEILAQLEQRLGNDPATELAVVSAQLREIALLRLAGLVEVAP